MYVPSVFSFLVIQEFEPLLKGPIREQVLGSFDVTPPSDILDEELIVYRHTVVVPDLRMPAIW